MITFNHNPQFESARQTCLRKMIWIFAFLWILPFLPKGILHAKETETTKTIIVMGAGKIPKNDTAAAREIAINESLISAVGQAIVATLPVEMINTNFFKINELIYGQTRQFIQGYRVLSETKLNDNYRVMVEVTVAVEKIKTQLANIGLDPDKKELPKIVLLISERNIGDEKPQYWWKPGLPVQKNATEKVLGEILHKQGFQIVKPGAVPSEMQVAGLDTPEPPNEAVLALAKHYQADIAIIGNAFAEQAANTMGGDILTYKGIVSARALRAETGEETAATYKSEVGAGADPKAGGREAIIRAANIAGEDIASKLLTALKTAKKESAHITIEVKGGHLLNHFIKLRKAIAEIPEVQNVQVSEMRAGVTMLVLNYPNVANQLAKMLLKKSFDGFGIHISTISEDRLVIEIIPANQREAPVQKEPSMQ